MRFFLGSHTFVFILVAIASFSGALYAQDPESVAQGSIDLSAPTAPLGFAALPPLGGNLVIGTSQNSSALGATLNDMFLVNPVANTSNSVATLEQVWGATADPANQRVLYTRSDGVCFGCQLVSVSFSGGVPSILGNITIGGADNRMDGLAVSGGVLYGSLAGGGATDGFYRIDLGTLAATLVFAYSDSISGIDADPATGMIYGVNDTTGQLVLIDPVGLNMTNVAPYPVGFTDIDGLAVGNGNAYLITDESQDINVYDLSSNSFVGVLTSPFANADIFSGGAFVAVQGPPAIVPALNSKGLWLLLLLVLVSGVAVRHRLSGK